LKIKSEQSIKAGLAIKSALDTITPEIPLKFENNDAITAQALEIGIKFDRI